MNDEAIVHQLLVGNRQVLHTFYQAWAPKLTRHIQTKVGNPKDVEEILQDTLFAFLEGLRDFAGTSSLQTYLFSICHHKIVDFYRRKKIGHIVFSRLPQIEVLVSPLFSPEEELDTQILKENIARALRRLLPRHRDILLLKYIDNLTVGDIARKLEITFKSAESQLFRARKAFVELFLSI